MRIALDSNVFIAAISPQEEHSNLAQKLIRDMSRGIHRAAASAIIYSEVLGLSKGSGLEVDLIEYLSLIENLSALPAGKEICIKAGELRLKHGPKLRLPDALHLA